MFDGLKGVKQQHEDQKYTHRHNDGQPFHGALLVFEFTTPGDEIAGRHLDLAHPRLHVRDHTAHVTPFDKNPDGCDAGPVLTADVHAAAGFLESGHFFERNVQAVGRVHEYLVHIGQAAFRLRQPYQDAEMLFAFPQFRRRFATEANLDLVLDITDVQAVARGAVAVNFDDGLRNQARPINVGSFHTGNAGDFP